MNTILNITDDIFQTAEIAEWATAFAAFQGKLTGVEKDGKSNRNKYITLDAILNQVRPLLAECGLFVTQEISGQYVTTTVIHKSGQFRGSRLEYRSMDGKGVNVLQNMGGGFTYIKRYAISAVLGISADTDDDGNSASLKMGGKSFTAEAVKVAQAEAEAKGQKLAFWAMVSPAKDLESLAAIWAANPSLQKNPHFTGAKEAKKTQLAK